MKPKVISSLALIGAFLLQCNAGAEKPTQNSTKNQSAQSVVQVAKSNRQWTGIAVSKTGRIFVCYPRWSDDVPVSVAELLPDGSTRPYPDAKWNQYNKNKAADCFVCVQSVFVDKDDSLWILDPAAPKFVGPVPDGPKLLKVDLKSGKVVNTFRFNDKVCPKGSYLNDLRIDYANNKIYITESGLGAIIVLDPKTGTAKRLLDKHSSTSAENITVSINGKPWTKKIAADSIALNDGYLYYKALTGKTLYRIPCKELARDEASTESVSKAVEKVADLFPTDGIEFGAGDLFLTSIEDNSIKRFNVKDKKLQTHASDSQMTWPDSFAIGANGWMYVTTSQINLGPKPKTPYRVFKFKYSQE